MTQSPLYDSFIAEYYDESPVVAARTQDIAFYRERARELGDPILELGCGTGRVALALGLAGHRVTGLDISSGMLNRFEAKLAGIAPDARARIRLVQGDMVVFDLGEKFRQVIIPFRPFQHLVETEEQLACLACVRKHLAPGGQLIVDFFQTDPRRMHDAEFLQERPIASYEMSEGRKVTLTERTAAFHQAEQCNDVEMIYSVTHADGRRERHAMAWRLRYFFRYEVEHLLARAGFRVEALYGGFDRSPFRSDSLEMVIVARAE